MTNPNFNTPNNNPMGPTGPMGGGNQPQKLYRDRNNRMISGVCAGLANYIGMDPTLMRVLWVILTLFTFVPVIAYVVLVFVVPES